MICAAIELVALAAKPVVDIQVSVADLDDEDRYVPPCEAAGFQPRFRGNGCTYCSATTFGARGGARDTYAAAKREAGRLWADQAAAYTEAKSRFVLASSARPSSGPTLRAGCYDTGVGAGRVPLIS